MRRNTIALFVMALAATDCASSNPNRVCDSVFFVPVNCKEVPGPMIASRSNTLPAPTPRSVAHEDAAPSPTPAPAQAAQVAAAPSPPAPPPEVPEINAVYFGVGKEVLSPGSRITLKRIADFLAQAKDEKIQLAAYTDPTGSAARNAALAERRADGVKAYLVAQGVDGARISVVPFNQTSAAKALPAAEYWRLRKVVALYGPETMARVEALEKEEDLHAENDIPEDPRPSKPAPKPTSGTVAAKEEEPKIETIDVLYWRNPNHALFIIAKKKGFFRDEGFNVRLHESKLEANELSVKLADEVGVVKQIQPRTAMDLKSRHYFLGGVCPYGYHEAIAKKLPFVEIGSLLTIPNTLLMKKELIAQTLKDPRSFRGTLGRMTNSSDISYMFLFADRLKRAGLKEGVDYKIKEFTTGTAMYDALWSGEIAAAVSVPPWDKEMVDQHPGFGMLPLASLNLNIPCCRQVVTRDQLRKNRAKYVRFERAVIRAQKYLIEHPNESIEIMSQFLSLSVPTIRAILQRAGFTLSANPNMKGALALGDIMAEHVGRGKVGDLRESSDTSVYEDALVSLAKEAPTDAVYNSMLATYNKTK